METKFYKDRKGDLLGYPVEEDLIESSPSEAPDEGGSGGSEQESQFEAEEEVRPKDKPKRVRKLK